jgi:DNA-binding transcriptional regulator YdaS (Cro superfamily)
MNTLFDVFVMMRAACKAAGGQAAWAEAHDMSPAYVSDVLNSRREPGPKILSALGLRKVVRYVAVAAAP